MTVSSHSSKTTFASDNYAGVHPQVLQAIIDANVGHASSYGNDPWTARLNSVVRELFGESASAFPVFNGTGANVVSLQAVTPRWGSVIASKSSHINNDEGAAPEKVGGLKILDIPTPDGKLTPELVAPRAWGWGDEHRPQPLAVSISQVTELGTCYTPQEIRALADFSHDKGMVLHMDGARIANAAAHLQVPLAEITSEAGVDILSLGGTKNGALGAEAIVVLNPEAVTGLPYLRKTNMQLGSKMRFLSAQLIALYEGDLWLELAQHANEMAEMLRNSLPETVPVPYAVESNVVFALLTAEQKKNAREKFDFYDWPGDENLVRLMCSYDATAEDVQELAEAIIRQ